MKSLNGFAVATTAAVIGLAGTSRAGVTYSTAAAFSAGQTLGNSTIGGETNQQQAELIQTFVPATTFKLGQFSILSGGKSGGSVTLHVYPINTTVTGQGGGNADGFVNTQFSTDLLNAGAGLTTTVNGSGSDQVINFAFTGTDQVTLTAGVEYGFEVDSGTSGVFSWERDGGGNFSTGNIYQAASGTTKGQVGGSVDRDGYFAAYAAAPAPEPTSLAAVSLGGAALLRRRRRA